MGWFNGEPFTFENVSYEYEYDSYWDYAGFGVIYSNGTWGLYYSNSYNPYPYIVEFDTNPDCSNPNKTYVCHNGNTICVNITSLQNHLDHGDFVGPCGPCNAYNMQSLPNENSEMEGHSPQPAKVVLSVPQEEPDVVQQISPSNQINIFPNPASAEIHVVLPEVNQKGNLRILSLTGQEIYTHPLSNQESIALDLSAFAAGIYLIDVRSATGHFQKKFVKL
jgi:hypothetical protein